MQHTSHKGLMPLINANNVPTVLQRCCNGVLTVVQLRKGKERKRKRKISKDVFEYEFVGASSLLLRPRFVLVTDIDFSGAVDFTDLRALAQYWLNN